jgi:hypothetical protein
MGNDFGPWATTLDMGSRAPLSTFWQRRMAMLTTLKNTKARVSWAVGVLIAVAGLAALTVPGIYFSSPSKVLAEDPGPPATEYFPPPTESEKKILDTLNRQTTRMEFTQTPLRDIGDYLTDAHGIPIKLDVKALEDAGQGPETPVDFSIAGVTLKSGLNLLLAQQDLTYLIKDEVLLITTKEKAESEVMTRTYPVGDLLDGGDEAKAYDNLIEVITSIAAPMSWAEAGGPGSMQKMPKSKSLVISQTWERQEEILDLLRNLRAARKTVAKDTR